MRRSNIALLSAGLLAGVPAAASEQCPTQDPALAKARVQTAQDVDSWGNLMFKKEEGRPEWYRQMKASADCAESVPALADLEDCLDHFKDVQLGFRTIHPANKCPQSVAAAANAPTRAAEHPDAARAAVASAQASANALASTSPQEEAAPASRMNSAFRDAAAMPQSDGLAQALRQKAQALVPPVAAPASNEGISSKALKTIDGAWKYASDAGEKIAAFMNPPPVDPLQGDRQRILANYAGLAPLLNKFTPDQQENYSRLISQAAASKDASSLRALEAPLKEIKNRTMAAARASVNGLAEPDLLAALQKKGAVSSRLSISRPGRLNAERDPSWSTEQWDRYVQWTLPLEAELVLGTKFPIAAVDRKQGHALVLRGEDYGTDRRAKAAQEVLDGLTKDASSAARAEQDAKTAAARAAGDAEAAAKSHEESEAQAKLLSARTSEASRLAAKASADAAEADRDSRAAAEIAQTNSEASAEEIRRALLKSGAGIDLQILFDYNSAKINEKARPQLAELGKALTGLKDLEFVVYGHTDAKGGAAYNLALSQRRAEAVKAYLAAPPFSIARERLTAQGFGAQRLARPDQPYSEMNRRVQIAVKGASDATEERSELEAKAAEAQAKLEARAAELAQKAADAARVAAEKVSVKQAAVLEEIQGRKDARESASALTAAEKTRDALAAALPVATAAKQAALAAVENEKPLAAAAAETAEGSLIVNGFRANHLSWFGEPQQLADRMEQTLTNGYAGHGNDGATATKLLSGVDSATNRTAAQDIAQEMERVESSKSNLAVLGEKLGDVVYPLQGRWLNMIGHVGRGPEFAIGDIVPDAAEKRPKQSPPQPIDIITESEFAQLSVKSAPSSGPASVVRPTPPAPETAEPDDRAAAAAKDAAIAITAQHEAEEAAAAARAHAAKASQAKQAADQAAATARGRRASAAQIRDALTKSATSASVDLEVYFAFDSAQITSAAVPQLNELGKAFSSSDFKGLTLFIYGHTDAVGSAAYNLDLSQRRAEAIRDYLVDHFALDSSRLIARGFGFQHLKIPSQPLSDQNRRVQAGVLR